MKKRVFVIKKRMWQDEDLIGFETDDILVVKNTTPDAQIILSRTAGLITEINNLLCHAAIISRESGVPLLMGQVGITNQLNTGDMIEVDFDKKIWKKF